MRAKGAEKLTWKEKFLDKMIEGDNKALFPNIPDDSIDLVITSPPYFQQRNYGLGMGNEPSIEDYLQNLLSVFHEAIRVIKTTGSIVFNLGDKYVKKSLQLIPFRFAIEASKKSVKLINTITWVKSNPTPHQYSQRLINATEPFFHFVKSDDYYYNRDAFLKTNEKPVRPLKVKKERAVGQKYFQLIDKSELTAEEKQHARSELRKVISEVKTGKLRGFRMKIRGIHQPAYGGQQGGRNNQIRNQGFTIIRIHGNKIKRDVIECAVETLKGSIHPAIYPVNLIKEFLFLLTKPGGIVLDPFMGSGSTALACLETDRHFIGFEINKEYCIQARKRIQKISKNLMQFLDD
ncbi:MAG: DNA-methyltransferase [Candidatus Helarchaeota archaeon]